MGTVTLMLAAGTTGFTVPSDWSNVNTVQCTGAGGGGGGNYNVDPSYGQSGGSGGFSETDNITAWLPGQVIPCTIPVGGAGDPATGPTSIPGGSPGPCFIGSASVGTALCAANSGTGGAPGASVATSSTGKGGSLTGAIGTTKFAGTDALPNNGPFGAPGASGPNGQGITPTTTDGTAADAGLGGAGGSSAGTGTAGANNSLGGGGGASPSDNPGTAGGRPGGGGGGGGSTNPNIGGGKGGNAQISITYTSSTTTGTLATTVADAAMSASGAQKFTAAMATTLDSVTAAVSGINRVPITATFSPATLGNAVANGFTGTLTFSGTLAQTLQPHTQAASGGLAISGFLGGYLDSSVSAIPAKETFSGTMASIALANYALNASGNQPIFGPLSQTLGNLIIAAAGNELFTGTLAKTLANHTMSASGAPNVVGTMGATLGAATSGTSGGQTYPGAMQPITLGGAFSTVAAQEIYGGGMAVTLGALAFTGTGAGFMVTGTLVATLQDFAIDFLGQVTAPTNIFEMGYWIVAHRRTHEL